MIGDFTHLGYNFNHLSGAKSEDRLGTMAAEEVQKTRKQSNIYLFVYTFSFLRESPRSGLFPRPPA